MTPALDDLRAKLERARDAALEAYQRYMLAGALSVRVDGEPMNRSEAALANKVFLSRQRLAMTAALKAALPALLDQAARVEAQAAELRDHIEQRVRLFRRVEALEGALRQAAEWFHQYEDMHAAKGSIDGDVKARTNAERADFCLSALSPASTSPSVGGGDE